MSRYMQLIYIQVVISPTITVSTVHISTLLSVITSIAVLAQQACWSNVIVAIIVM